MKVLTSYKLLRVGRYKLDDTSWSLQALDVRNTTIQKFTKICLLTKMLAHQDKKCSKWFTDRSVRVLVHIATVRLAQNMTTQVVCEAGVGLVVLDEVRVVDVEAKRIARHMVLVLVGNRQVPVLHDFPVHVRVRSGRHVAW